MDKEGAVVLTKKYSLTISSECPWLTKPNSLELLHKMIIENEYELVAIQFGQWMANDFQKVCRYIEQWTVEHLYLYKNQCPTIIKEVSEIRSLPSLTQLHLQSNLIESIEPLCKLNSPALMKLYLNNNKICDLRTLRKCSFRYLVTLEINGNCIREFKDLFEYGDKELQNLRIDSLFSSKPYSQNCGEMMRWETKKLKDIGRATSYKILNIHSNIMRPRVLFEEMMNMMKKKYIGITIWAMK